MPYFTKSDALSNRAAKLVSVSLTLGRAVMKARRLMI